MPEKPVKITVDLGDRELYKELRLAAVQQDRTVRDIVIEALRAWLAEQKSAVQP